MKAKLKFFTSYRDIFDTNKNNITFDEFCLKWCEPYNIIKQVITKNVLKNDTDSICELLKNGFKIDWVDSVGISLVKTIEDPIYIDTEYNASIKDLYEKYIEFANKRIDYENQIIELSKNAKEKTNEKYFLENELRKVELEGKNIPIQEEFNKFFEKNIFTLIDHSKTKFLDCNGQVSKTPTSRIQLSNSAGNFIFDYDSNPIKPHFWYSYNRVFTILMSKFYLKDDNIRGRLMKNLVEKHFNLYSVTPNLYSYFI